MDPQHIPGGTARDILFNRLPNNPGELLREALYPEDSYSGETYWADLPKAERTKWIFKQQNKENARELRTIWEIFKKDPLAPLWLYFKKCVHHYFVGLDEIMIHDCYRTLRSHEYPATP